MLLYATVTSERATKGQGGKFLNIEIRDENRTVYLVNVQKNGEDTDLTIIETTKGGAGSLTHKETLLSTKGKKQKAEHENCVLDCADCGGCLEHGCDCK